MNEQDLCYLPAVEMAKAIREKRLSPVEITQALLQRIQAVNPKLNAYCTVTAEHALDEARRAEAAVMQGGPLGPLHGVPYSVKDLIVTQGVRTMRGSAIYEQFVPDEDAPTVERLRAAGGVMLGKTCTPEFGWKGMTDSPLTGITRNPWDLDRTPGGSSGGASAQVAAGLGPLAIGTDGGGSIRIPSGFAGIFGIKPTYGRVPVYPPSAFDALSHVGPMSRTVADAALMLSVLAGAHPADRFSLDAPPGDYLERLHEGIQGLKVAWSPDLGYAAVDQQVAAITARAAQAFGELGAHVEEVNPGWGDPTPIFMVFWKVGAAGMLGSYLARWAGRMDQGLVEVVVAGLSTPALEFAQAQLARHQYCDKVRRFFQRYDLLLTPGLAVLPFQAGAPAPAEVNGRALDWITWTPFTYPFNLAPNPAASVPAGMSREGLPVALQIVGPRLGDLRVLQAAAAFEQARPWAQHRPTL
ncbi:MAG: amidase [Candidatus Lambdaproteobacteria bacterium]|nr:amidase [Candidatus Lambdaproteobacteria bacterium]